MKIDFHRCLDQPESKVSTLQPTCVVLTFRITLRGFKN